MQKLFSSLIVLFISFSGIYAQADQRYAPDQLIISFKSTENLDSDAITQSAEFGLADLDLINQRHGLEEVSLTGNPHLKNTFLLKFGSAVDVIMLTDEYQETDLFEYVEPNFIGSSGGKQMMGPPILPNDEHFNRQYGLYNTGSFAFGNPVPDADIDMELAWDIETGSSNIVVAILDSGTKLNHPEFSGRLWFNSGENLDGVDNDNNGHIDDINGWDFAYDDGNPNDAYGHGTNVMGIIGANGNNNLGFAGVDWNCKLMPLKVLNDDDFGFYTWWAAGVYYAVDQGAHVINMSLVGLDFSATLNDAINYAYNNGVTVVACMGNNNNAVTGYPAGYTNAIAVGATDPDDTRAVPFFWSNTSGSNYGDHIDIIAPGNYMYGLSYFSNTNFNSYWGGTSQATPLAAGVCALLLAQDPTRTPDDLRSILRNTAEDGVGDPSEDTPGFDIYYGYGRLNAHAALSGGVTSTEDPYGTQFSVYPNPADQFLAITLPDGEFEVKIFDQTGKLLEKDFKSNLEGSPNINVTNYPEGIYLITIRDIQNNIQSTRKFMVK